MARTPENIHRHELIGLEIQVEEHSDPEIEGIKGKVVDETQNTLVIDSTTVAKQGAVFIFTLPKGEKVRVKGNIIHKRPEERINS